MARRKLIRTLEEWRPALAAVLGYVPDMEVPPESQDGELTADEVYEQLTAGMLPDPRLLDPSFAERALNDAADILDPLPAPRA